MKNLAAIALLTLAVNAFASEERVAICSGIEAEAGAFRVWTSSSCVDFIETADGKFRPEQGMCLTVMTQHMVVPKNDEIESKLTALIGTGKSVCVNGVYSYVKNEMTVDRIFDQDKLPVADF